MSDDLWRSELAQVNREQQQEDRRRLDERWDRLSRGELSSEEEAGLRALAATSEEARMAWEAFRPLGPDFHARVVQAVRVQKPALLLPFRRRALVRWGAAAALAAAACVALVLRPLAPLPDYSRPEVSGGVSVWRGEAAAEAPVLAPGDRFQVIVRPRTAMARASRLEALCFVERDREVRPLEVRSEIDAGGAVRMEGSVGRDLQPGEWTLWTVVGRRGRLPDPASWNSVAPEAPVRQRDWVAVPADLRILPRRGPPP